MSSNDSQVKPLVVLVGTIDVDARIELMKRLSDKVRVRAAGTTEDQRARFTAAGFEYDQYNMGRGANPIADKKALAELQLLFERLKPDVVHTFDTKPCVWARKAARRAGVPVVIGTNTGLGGLYVANDPKTKVFRAIYEFLQKSSSIESDMTAFYNRDDEREFLQKGIVPQGKHTMVPGSGVITSNIGRHLLKPEQIEEARRAMGKQEGEIVVTMVSRVFRAKGVVEFATAAVEARKEFPELRFVLVGGVDEDARDPLTDSESEFIRESVTWLGARKDIPAILASTDIFALPTMYREGIPRVLLEAGAMDVPLIATDMPGCREVVVEGKNGFLITPGSASALRDAVLKLAKDKELREKMGEAARKITEEVFDLTIIAGKYLELYRILLDSKKQLAR